MMDKRPNFTKDLVASLREASAIECEPHTAAKTMMETKQHYGKTDGVSIYHIIQSFKPDEITPELAHELGLRFAREYLRGYEIVIGTHVDKDHIHNHIAFNSVSAETGLKYQSSPESYYKGIRAVSDRLCRENGLNVIMDSGTKGLSYAEWKLKKAGLLTYRELLEQDVSEVLSVALDVGNFYELMEACGYTVEHHSRYPSFIPNGSKSPYRAKDGGKSLTEDDIRAILEHVLTEPITEVLLSKQYAPYTPRGKQKGFRALYVSWLYVLGVIGKGGKVKNCRVPYVEVKRFDQYKRQAEYLEEHKIDTAEQLEERKAVIQSEMETLTKTRIILNSRKKKNARLYSALSDVEYYSDAAKLYEEGTAGIEEDYRKYMAAEAVLQGQEVEALKNDKAEVYERLAEVNARLRKLRGEMRMCEQAKVDALYVILMCTPCQGQFSSCRFKSRKAYDIVIMLYRQGG